MYQIFLSFCFPFILSLRIDVKPHPRVTHCAGRVQNYFGFLLAQTSAVPRGCGKDDTSVNRARECPKFLFLLLLLLLVIIIIIIIFATNKQCNHNFCTQQHCWYHMAYILYYWIRAYPITVLYLLLLFYTLRLNTDYFIVYDISFFWTHHKIIIELSFESIILLNLLLLYLL